MDGQKKVIQMSTVRVSECERDGILDVAEKLDRSPSWVRRAAYRAFILAHGFSVGDDFDDDSNYRESHCNSSIGGRDRNDES